jgi:hypothetical protein
LDCDDVLSILTLRWPQNSVRRRTLHDGNLGQDCSWAQIIDIYESTVAHHLWIVAATPGMPSRMKIAHRVIIDSCLRKASDMAQFYSIPLYVSAGFLAEVDLGNRRYDGHTEHVIPLSLCSGTRMMDDPALFQTFRMAAIGPLCKVSVQEHQDLNRRALKTHPDAGLPFLRYDGLIDVYRTDNGHRVDGRTWTFAAHLDLMKLFPAYATGATHYEAGARRMAT